MSGAKRTHSAAGGSHTHGGKHAKVAERTAKYKTSHGTAKSASGRMMPGAMRMPIRREIKFVDNALTVSPFQNAATPPTSIYLGGPVQGAAPYQRIGQKIVNKSLHLRGFITATAAAGAIPEDLGRIVVVYDEQTNGAAPAWADVVYSYTAAGSSASSAFDGLNMNNRERFKVLVDEQIRFPACTMGSSAGVVSALFQPDATGNTAAAKWNFERYVRLNGLVTHYKATAGGVGDVATGAIFMFCMDQTNSGSWTFNWGSRLRYDDL